MNLTIHLANGKKENLFRLESTCSTDYTYYRFLSHEKYLFCTWVILYTSIVQVVTELWDGA